MKTYAAYYDNAIREKSSSGGVFSALATSFEIVYGVQMDATNQNAIFARKTSKIAPLCGSKYIQAKMGDTFKFIRNDLGEEKKVLFSGTACQVNGLMAFLKKEYPNLLTIDVVCHGAPSPKYWEKYTEGIAVRNVDFRSKQVGWRNYGMELNEKFIPNNDNKFMKLYLQNQCLRPSCFDCVCKQVKRSDITIGDFWGIENVAPEFDDNRGVSLVIVRTDKGQMFFDAIKERLVYKEVSYEDGVKENPSEFSSVERPLNREEFFIDIEKMSFDKLYEKYVPRLSLLQKIRGSIKTHIRR